MKPGTLAKRNLECGSQHRPTAELRLLHTQVELKVLRTGLREDTLFACITPVNCKGRGAPIAPGTHKAGEKPAMTAQLVLDEGRHFRCWGKLSSSNFGYRRTCSCEQNGSHLACYVLWLLVWPVAKANSPAVVLNATPTTCCMQQL